MNRTFPLAAFAAFAALAALAAPASADPVKMAVTTAESTTLGTLATDDEKVVLLSIGGAWALGLSALTDQIPPEAGLDAISSVAPGQIVFSLDSDQVVGSVAAADEDLFLFAGGVFTLLWDGSDNGLPADADLDAVDVVSLSPLVFSFSLNADALLTVGGAVVIVHDEDAVRFEEGSGFTQFEFVGATVGVPPEADMDAFSRLPSGEFLVSFDSPIRVGGATHDDADVLRYSPADMQFAAVPFLDSAASQIPSEADVTDIEGNSARLTGSLFGPIRDALLGLLPSDPSFDLNADGAVDDADLLISLEAN